MTDKMKTALAEEIDLIQNWLAYEDANELEYMTSLSDARVQIHGMTAGRDPDDPLPAGLLDPATMLIVWNYCVDEEKRMLKEREEEREARERPNREYLLKIVCDDIKQASIKTGKQIADIYETDQIAGIYSSMRVYDLDTLQEISLLDLVEPILANKRWMEQEYRDYCDAVNEYGYDFEGRDE